MSQRTYFSFLLPFCVLLCIYYFVFAQIYRTEFFLFEHEKITNNTLFKLQRFPTLRHIFRTNDEGEKVELWSSTSARYRPLAVFILLIIHSIFLRLQIPIPSGFHFVQISLHAVNAFLVLIISNTFLSHKIDISAFVSLLFFIHPVNIRTFLCIDAFGEEISTFLFLVALLLYMKYAVYITPRDGCGNSDLRSKTYIFMICILIVGIGTFSVDLNLIPLLFFGCLDCLTNVLKRRPNIGTIIVHNLLITFELLFILGVRSLILREDFSSFLSVTYQQFGNHKPLNILSDLFVGLIHLIHGLSLLVIPIHLSVFYTDDSLTLAFSDPHSTVFSKLPFSVAFLLFFFFQTFETLRTYYTSSAKRMSTVTTTSGHFTENSKTSSEPCHQEEISNMSTSLGDSQSHPAVIDQQQEHSTENLNNQTSLASNNSNRTSLELYHLQKFRIILLSSLLVILFLPFVQHFGFFPFLSVQYYPVQFRESTLYTPSFVFALCVGAFVKRRVLNPPHAQVFVLFVLFLLLLNLSIVQTLYYSDEVLLLRQSLKLFPKNVELLMRMNDILKSRNEPQLLDEHINILNSLVARFPIYCAFRHDLAVTLIKKGFYREAQSAEQAALSCTNWCRSDYIVSLVEIYMKQNQLWKAESLLRRALILFEDGTGLHLLATIIEQRQQKQQKWRDRLDEAIKLWQKAINFDPRADIHFALGKALAKEGRLKEAEEHFHKALISEPQRDDIKNQLQLLQNEMAEAD